MKLKLKIYLLNSEGRQFMGIGVLWLLEGIKRLGSIKKAAEEMNMSYAKAHAMVNALEEALGEKVLIRKKGGETREGAALTPFGIAFVKEYDDFQNDLKQYGTGQYQKFIQRIEDLK